MSGSKIVSVSIINHISLVGAKDELLYDGRTWRVWCVDSAPQFAKIQVDMLLDITHNQGIELTVGDVSRNNKVGNVYRHQFVYKLYYISQMKICHQWKRLYFVSVSLA